MYAEIRQWRRATMDASTRAIAAQTTETIGLATDLFLACYDQEISHLGSKSFLVFLIERAIH